MEKFKSTIEYLVPVMLAYPAWAQVLFLCTILLLLLSAVVFIRLYPPASEEISSFAVTSPTSGDFISSKSFCIEGRGANPAETNAYKIRLTNIRSNDQVSFKGHLTVTSDSSWRSDLLELQSEGEYDLLIEAIVGKKKYSKTLRINYDDITDTPRPSPSPSDRPDSSSKASDSPWVSHY
jgi:hypothetical protein